MWKAEYQSCESDEGRWSDRGGCAHAENNCAPGGQRGIVGKVRGNVGKEPVFHPRKMGCPAGTGQSGKPSQCIDDRSAIKAKPDVDLQDLEQTVLLN